MPLILDILLSFFFFFWLIVGRYEIGTLDTSD